MRTGSCRSGCTVSGSDLVLRDDSAPVGAEFAEAAKAIARLGSEHDVDSLREVTAETTARAKYFERKHHMEAAIACARLRILAELELGEFLLDGEALPELIDAERMRIQAVAVARRRGMLESVLAGAEPSALLTTNGLYRALSSKGALSVPGGCLKAAFAAAGTTKGTVARLTGVTPKTVQRLCEHTDSKTVFWVNARLVAEFLGVNPSSLPAARTRHPGRHRRYWLRRQARLTGGRWDETYSRFRRCLDEFARVAGEGREWDEAYAHFYELEKMIAKGMRRDGLEGRRAA